MFVQKTSNVIYVKLYSDIQLLMENRHKETKGVYCKLNTFLSEVLEILKRELGRLRVVSDW